MINQLSNRRDFSVRLATLLPALGIAGTSLASAADATDDVISHTADSIPCFQGQPQARLQGPYRHQAVR